MGPSGDKPGLRFSLSYWKHPGRRAAHLVHHQPSLSLRPNKSPLPQTGSREPGRGSCRRQRYPDSAPQEVP